MERIMAVTLGSIVLRDFEIPSVIRYGGTQRLAVHHLGNGRRAVDALGVDETDLVFSGVLSGPDATERARGLDSMRVAGQKVQLTWDSFHFEVLIKQFHAEFRSHQWIEFQLTCMAISTGSRQVTERRETDQADLTRDILSLSLGDGRLSSILAPLRSNDLSASEVIKSLNAAIEAVTKNITDTEIAMTSGQSVQHARDVLLLARLKALRIKMDNQ
jgi:hypothetical protein